jgi:hypothetical protein
MLPEWMTNALDRWRTGATLVRGVRVIVTNTRPDIDTAAVIARLDAALGLIERYAPSHFRRLRRDFAAIQVIRYPCRGAFDPGTRICIVELTFSVNPEFNDAQVAATILHEAMHARLHAMGVREDSVSRAREERFCRRAEIEFGRVVPGGAPVVERALATLASSDAEVAPEIDWQVAMQRVRDRDRG